MNTKKIKILLSIILILPALLLIYNLSNQGIPKDNYNMKNSTQTVSNNSPSEKSDYKNQSYNYSHKNNIINGNINIEEKNSQNNYSNENTQAPEKTTTPMISNLKSISMDSYKLDLTYSTYIVKQGDTVTNIVESFKDTCNYKTALTHLKLLNPNINLNELEIDSTLNIPTLALQTGRLYKVVSGDTWYKLAKSNYSEYNTDAIIDFLISINDLPNFDLPIDENIFLPNL